MVCITYIYHKFKSIHAGKDIRYIRCIWVVILPRLIPLSTYQSLCHFWTCQEVFLQEEAGITRRKIFDARAFKQFQAMRETLDL